MSESAIESAETAMRESLGEAAPIFFHISDMLSYLQKVRGTFDVIVAAFAIHHLTSEDKQMVEPSAPSFELVGCRRQELHTPKNAHCFSRRKHMFLRRKIIPISHSAAPSQSARLGVTLTGNCRP